MNVSSFLDVSWPLGYEKNMSLDFPDFFRFLYILINYYLRFSQIRSNFFKFLQILSKSVRFSPNPPISLRFFQIPPVSCKFAKIPSDCFRFFTNFSGYHKLFRILSVSAGFSQISSDFFELSHILSNSLRIVHRWNRFKFFKILSNFSRSLQIPADCSWFFDVYLDPSRFF